MVDSRDSKWKFILSLMMISILFENLTIANILGGALKFHHIVAILGIILCVFDGKLFINIKEFFISFFAILIPLLPLHRIKDSQEFFKTYLIYVLFILFLLLCFKKLKNAFRSNYSFFYNFFVIIIEFAVLFGILQFIFNNAFDLSSLNNIFGDLEFQKLNPGIVQGFRRANSIYHEPSYFGWICCLGLTLLLYDKNNFVKHKVLRYCLILAGVAVSFSTAAYFVTVVLIISFFFLQENKLVTVVGMVSFLLIFLIFWNFAGISDVFNKVYTVRSEGTSSYERFVSPFKYVINTFQHYPLFGRGMGQEGKIDLVGTVGRYDSVNNSIFGVFVVFGTTALFYIVLYFRTFFKYAKNDKLSLIFLIMTFGMYLSTGAFLAFDTAIILIACLLTIREETLCYNYLPDMEGVY